MTERMPCDITDGPASEMDAHEEAQARPEREYDGQGLSDCLLGPRVDNWARNLLAVAGWRGRMHAAACGLVEPDMRNAEQRRLGGRIRAHLFILKYVLNRIRRGP